MELRSVTSTQWQEIKKIYLEAFPKRERKPFLSLQRSAKKKKTVILTASEAGQLCGFTVVIPYEDMVMVDYLAVSSAIRSKGTGSILLQHVCQKYPNKKIVLLIEALDDTADNSEQRIARRRFYTKNGFTSSGLFLTGASGAMEIMIYGGQISQNAYMRLQKYALGNLFFRLSRIKITNKVSSV